MCSSAIEILAQSYHIITCAAIISPTYQCNCGRSFHRKGNLIRLNIETFVELLSLEGILELCCHITHYIQWASAKSVCVFSIVWKPNCTGMGNTQIKSVPL